ncbi:hypothetical protein PVAND_011347 [Polypedilum vanderplanki]|uniref:Protein takeout-like protein n=1 Tax=Polypedilum vanderplanki TaxID=319348 RepID=A0A9J6CIA2_POLVA|nr:hypothetical protein PVAND_011347 [Polypedilum vanderplanki]
MHQIRIPVDLELKAIPKAIIYVSHLSAFPYPTTPYKRRCNENQIKANDIEKCNYGDSKCMIEKLNDVFQNKHKGYQQLLLLPTLDPLHINKMSLVQGAESSRVKIALHFNNIDMLGLSKAEVYKASGFNKASDLDMIEIRFKTPKLMIVGPYKANGRIVLLPLIGAGYSTLMLENVHFLMKFKAKIIEQNGKSHLQLNKSKMTFNTTRLYMNFTDLFNGNSELGKNMNKFINENWRDILDDLKRTIVQSFGDVFSTIINHIFNNFPYAEMFN